MPRAPLSKSGYYTHLRRAPSRRKREDDALKVRITTIHEQSGRTYGSPRVHKQLRHEDFEVGRDRVARLMRELQRCGTPKRRYRCTTDSNHDAPVAPNLLQRDFEAELALAALRMALGRRMPEPGLVHHSDRGVQYAAHAYQNVLHQHGIVCSTSRKADCWDNAVAESFFARLKTELLHRRRYRRHRRRTRPSRSPRSQAKQPIDHVKASVLFPSDRPSISRAPLFRLAAVRHSHSPLELQPWIVS